MHLVKFLFFQSVNAISTPDELVRQKAFISCTFHATCCCLMHEMVCVTLCKNLLRQNQMQTGDFLLNWWEICLRRLRQGVLHPVLMFWVACKQDIWPGLRSKPLRNARARQVLWLDPCGHFYRKVLRSGLKI